MKKMLISILLLLSSIIYLIWRMTIDTIYHSDISMEATNPVSFHWWYLQIDTKLIENSEKSLYSVSLIPIYVMIVIALILVFMSLKRKS